MTTWSVHLNETETGGTGLPSEEFAKAVYERLCEMVKARGQGTVVLSRDGEVVVSFTVEEAKR